MTFHLSDLVLYPRGSGQPRVLAFNEDTSVITGDSKTGKSSLIDIVDYCLGSTQCDVAEGVVRRTVAWYAARFDLHGRQLFVARRAPEEGAQSSGEVYLQQGLDLGLPDQSELHAVTNRDGLVALLTEYLGIPPTADVEQSLLPAYNLSIRQASPYLFQKQFELSSPAVLFHGADNGFVARAIREAMPFFVGAIGVDDIAAARQLVELRREARELRARLQSIEAAIGTDATKANALVREAIEVGLLDPQEVTTREDAIRLLQGMTPAQIDTREEPRDDDAALAERLRLLTQRQVELRATYSDLQDQLEALHAFGSLRGAFAGEAAEQEARLTSVELLPRAEGSHRACPLCETPLTAAVPLADELIADLESLRTTIAAFASDPPQMSATQESLRAQSVEVRQRLASITSEIGSLQQNRRRLAALADERERRAVVLGRASYYLESVQEGDASADVRARLRVVDLRIDEIERRIGADVVRERLDSVSAWLTQDMGTLAEGLDLEWSGLPIFLDFRRLSVACVAPEGSIYLDRMGSGENWVAYHLLVHLSLHRLFARRRRPVPRFLFLDQPSQIYFPTDADVAAASAGERSGDMAAVERLLRMVFNAARGQGFQVILTEHASFAENWFQSSVVQDWRDGRALIPPEWL